MSLADPRLIHITPCISDCSVQASNKRSVYWSKVCIAHSGHYYQAFKMDPVCAVYIVIFITSLCAVHYYNCCCVMVEKIIDVGWMVKNNNSKKTKKKCSGLLNESSFMNSRLCSSFLYIHVCFLRHLDIWDLYWHFVVPR